MVNADAQEGWESRVEPWQPGTEPPAGLLQSWRASRAPFVRVVGVEVLRVGDVIAPDVLAVLREWGIPTGPVLINVPRRCVEVLVPLGSSATWPPLPYTRCVPTALMRCPAPDITRDSARWREGRTWAMPPGAGPETTSAAVLAEIVPEARRRAEVRRLVADGPTGRARRRHSREGQQS
ncbi:hypothetical protein [Streptomyces pseudovenezuelae]|uniref:hypothetical protein n=1 Tax=Streptomyces pseudovenezuelae TaxID=67350 RepID=UPI0036E74620